MKILITNSVLLGRSGTEIFVAQLADELHRRGHEVMLYSPRIGPFGLALRRAGHLVFEHIADIGTTPDIIHAHHIGPALTVFTAFPNTPAIFIAHSVESEFDAMPQHPSVVRHMAVSNFVRAQRAKDWLPMAQITLLKNAVDLMQFQRRCALPSRPKTALAVVKYQPGISTIRRFCEQAGLDLQVVGDGAGNITDDLPARFQQADLVFATGRSALEALATGCAVILTDGGLFGGLIGSDRIAALLDENLGVHTVPQRLTEAALQAAFASYDSADQQRVTAHVRETAALTGQADRLLEIYAAAIAQGVGRTDRMKMASLVEAYVPNHGLLPWRRLVTDLIDSASLAKLNYFSDPVRYEVSEEAPMRHQTIERLLAEPQPDTAGAAEAELAAIYQSTSWRVTAWLRWLGNRMPRH